MAKSPTVGRRQLGSELRRLREASGFTIEDVAQHLECSMSKVSRMETGRVPFRTSDVRVLFDLYGVTDESEQEALLNFARDSRQPGWWQSYSDVLPSWFKHRLGLEADATSHRTYQTQLVPGLLQTEDYARAVIRAAHPNALGEEIERRVSLRLARQTLIEQENAPLLWLILDEAVLRRPVGGARVMKGQLARLREVADMSNITFQVVPFAAGAHASLGSSFTVLRFPDSEDSDVIYVEELTSSFYLDKWDDVQTYCKAFDHLRASALEPSESLTLVDRVNNDL